MRSPLGIICVAIFSLHLSDQAPLDWISMQQVKLDIPQGTVVGTIADSGFYEFFGIPYADTTAGQNRFKAAVPSPPFTEVFYANRKGIKCIRPLDVGYEGTEDCLVVDIITPSLDNTSKLSVIVWINGQEIDKTYGDKKPFESFVEKDVIVVSINFRQSIFGFLCLETETAPGNAGLKDIIASLRWIQENIESFGGNPNDITLFGHGNVAAIVDLVIVSPLSKGLVHKAISQSKSTVTPWAVGQNTLFAATQITESLGHTKIKSNEDLSAVLTKASIPALMAIINQLDLTENSLAFSPCVETKLTGVEPFLTETPMESISKGDLLNIPLLIGFFENEDTVLYQENDRPRWLDELKEPPNTYWQSRNEHDRTQVTGDENTSHYDPVPFSIPRYTTYHGDTMILVSTIKEARLRAASSSVPVYLYQYTYKGDLDIKERSIQEKAAAYNEDFTDLFYEPLVLDNDGVTTRNYTLIDIMTERLTNFAKTGNPTSETSQVVWQQFTIDNPRYLRLQNVEIGEATSSVVDVQQENLSLDVIAFWEEVFAEDFLDAESKQTNIQRNDEGDAVPEMNTTLLPDNAETPQPPEVLEPTLPPGNNIMPTVPPLVTTPPVEVNPTSPPEGLEPTPPPEEIDPTSPPEEIEPTPSPEEIDPTSPPEEIEPSSAPEEIDPTSPPEEISPTQPPVELDPTSPPEEIQPTPPPVEVNPTSPPEEIEPSPAPEELDPTSPPEDLVSTTSVNLNPRPEPDDTTPTPDGDVTTPPTDGDTSPDEDTPDEDPPEEEDPSEPDGETTTPDPEGNGVAASAAIKYTFSVIVAFALLEKFHLAQILS